MRDLRIILQDNELDIKGEVGFPLNYSVSDVKDPSKRNASYSKTVTLVGSKNNNKVLGGLFDINSDFTFFNPNFKTECTIVLNSTTVMSGFLKLLSIDIVSSSFIEGDYVEYKCVIGGVTSDFFTVIKNKMLNELDFSKKNHTLNHTNIVSSWDNTSNDVFTYPTLYKNSNSYTVEDFKPSIFRKAYLKRMVLEAGYQITGDLLDETTVEGAAFARDIIPFCGDIPKLSDTEIERRKFHVSLGLGATLLENATINCPSASSPWTGFNNTPVQIEYTDETGTGNFDNGGLFDSSFGDYSFKPDKSGLYSLGVDTNVSATFTTAVNVNLQQFSWAGQSSNNIGGYDAARGTADTSFRFAIGVYVNGVLRGHEDMTPDLSMPNTVSSGSPSVVASVVNYKNPSIYLLAGEVVTVRARVISPSYNSGLFIQYSQHNIDTHPIDTFVNLSCTASNFYNGLTNGQISDGDEVIVSDFIPVGIKQGDILTDIIKRYNAYITVDEINEKLLRIETRDGYYARGGVADWTNLKDYSDKDEIVLLSELQNKEVLFTHKLGEDSFSNNYNATVSGEVFGQKEVVYDNEFVTGTQKIESPFASSPLVYSDGTKAMIVSSIGETNPVVLNYGGLINCQTGTNWNITHNVGGVATTTTYTTYPYAGHYDNPYTPSYDINYGSLPFEYYKTRLNNTEGNLYNRFWKNYIEQINEGRKITMSFNLNEVVIGFIKDNLNTRIFVRDSWYIINKIIDYDASIEKTTRVELLKVKDAVTFAYSPKDFDPSTEVDNDGGGEHTGSTTIDSQDVIVAGDEIYIGAGSDNTAVVGFNSRVGSNSPNSVIYGANNTICSQIVNGFIIGTSGKTISQSNTGYIGETFYRNGIPAIENNTNTVSQLITLRDNDGLIAGLDYFATDFGIYFKALTSNSLNFNTQKTIRVIKNANYTTLDMWRSGSTYSIDDKVIYGGVVWNYNGDPQSDGGGDDAVDDFNLATPYFNVDLTEDYYTHISLDVKYQEETNQIIEASDNRGNVVQSTNDNFLFNSDWNDYRISNNITAGFVNNDATNIINNSNNGLIINNTIATGFTMTINNNSNNGNIQNLRAICNAFISANTNNDDIGSGIETEVGNCENANNTYDKSN